MPQTSRVRRQNNHTRAGLSRIYNIPIIQNQCLGGDFFSVQLWDIKDTPEGLVVGSSPQYPQKSFCFWRSLKNPLYCKNFSSNLNFSAFPSGVVITTGIQWGSWSEGKDFGKFFLLLYQCSDLQAGKVSVPWSFSGLETSSESQRENRTRPVKHRHPPSDLFINLFIITPNPAWSAAPAQKYPHRFVCCFLQNRTLCKAN